MGRGALHRVPVAARAHAAPFVMGVPLVVARTWTPGHRAVGGRRASILARSVGSAPEHPAPGHARLGDGRPERRVGPPAGPGVFRANAASLRHRRPEPHEADRPRATAKRSERQLRARGKRSLAAPTLDLPDTRNPHSERATLGDALKGGHAPRLALMIEPARPRKRVCRPRREDEPALVLNRQSRSRARSTLVAPP